MRREERVALGRAIHTLRLERGLRIADLAREAGISAGHLGKIERGHGNPRFPTLNALARALDIRPSVLYREADRAVDLQDAELAEVEAHGARDTPDPPHGRRQRRDGAMSEKRELIAFGRAVRQIREQQGLSIEAVAAAAGVADGELDPIEVGYLDPGSLGVLHLATALGVTGTALMLRVEELERGGEA